MVEHTGYMQARLAEHAGKCHHATCYLLMTAMIVKIALEQRGEMLHGVALVGCPEQMVGALYAGGEEVEHVVAEDVVGEEVVDNILLADYEGTHGG